MKRTKWQKKLGKLLIYLVVVGGTLLFAPSLNSDDFDISGLYFQNLAEDSSGEIGSDREKPYQQKLITSQGILGDIREYKEIDNKEIDKNK